MWPIARAWAAFPMRAAALLALLLSALLPVNAQAHAVLVQSSPANNQVVKEAPTQIQLHFNEPVRIVRASARLADDTTVDLAPPGGGADISLRLPSLGRGTAIVSYRVVSEDGHPVGGAVVFHVGAASAAPAGPAATNSFPLDAGIWAVHSVSILFLAYVVGGKLFAALFSPSSARVRRPTFVVLAGFVLLGSGLYLQGLDEIGAGLQFGGLAPLAAVLASNASVAAGLSMIATILAVLPPYRSGKLKTATAAVAMAIASAAFTFTGHCAIVTPAWLAKACIFFHGGVLLFWIGSLLPLWRLSRHPSGQESLRGFSAAIPVPFVAMLLAGLTLALLELPNIHSMLASIYGRVLVVKIALVIALCVLAAYNRFWLTGPAIKGDATARRRLRGTISAEVILAVAIVCTASLWRFAGPDQFQYALAEPLSIHMHSDQAMAQLELQPTSPDAATVHVAVVTSEFEPLHPKAVTIRLRNPSAGVEAMKFDLRDAGEGLWTAEGLPFRGPGGWKVDVQILVNDYTSAHLEADLDENVRTAADAQQPGTR